MLGEDQADDAAASGDSPDRLLVDAVLLVPESKGAVRGDHRDPPIGIQLVEELEGVGDRPGAHVREVDHDALANHRPDRGPAELGEAELGLGKHQPVEPVGKKRQGRRVGGNAAPEQVREDDVRDAPARQGGHRGVDRLGRLAEVKAALDAVDQRDAPAVELAIERVGITNDRGGGGVALVDVRLDHVELADQARQVFGLRRRAVWSIEVELVEERVDHRERDADPALLKLGDRHPRSALERAVVGDPAGEPDQPGADPVAQPVAPVRGREQVDRGPGRLRQQVHRVVGVEVDDHPCAASARSLRCRTRFQVLPSTRSDAGAVRETEDLGAGLVRVAHRPARDHPLAVVDGQVQVARAAQAGVRQPIVDGASPPVERRAELGRVGIERFPEPVEQPAEEGPELAPAHLALEGGGALPLRALARGARWTVADRARDHPLAVAPPPGPVDPVTEPRDRRPGFGSVAVGMIDPDRVRVGARFEVRRVRKRRHVDDRVAAALALDPLDVAGRARLA